MAVLAEGAEIDAAAGSLGVFGTDERVDPVAGEFTDALIAVGAGEATDEGLGGCAGAFVATGTGEDTDGPG